MQDQLTKSMVRCQEVQLVLWKPAFFPSLPCVDGCLGHGVRPRRTFTALFMTLPQPGKSINTSGRRSAWSRVSEKGELAMLTGQIRRSLSLEAVRSQARCLLGRLSGLGAGAASAARRRAWAETDERRMDRERRAYLPHALSTIPNFTINVSKPKYFGFIQKVRNCPLCLGYV